MPATALIQLTQNAVTPGPGVALVGTADDGAVSVGNDDNTGVTSWQIDLAYVAPGSSVPVAVPLAFSNSGNTPAASFSPDVPGSYRLVLKVWDVVNRTGDPTDVDIRNFVILAPNGLVIPPYQKDPDPLPTLASGEPGAKPNEMNIGGLELGWAGNGLSDGLLNQAIALIGSSGLPPLSSAVNRDVLTTDDFVPFLNLPTAVTYDGTSLWVLKSNVAALQGIGPPTSWGVAKIDLATFRYVEEIDSKSGVQAPAPLEPAYQEYLDAMGHLLWTGTQLFAIGVNTVLGQVVIREVLRGTGPGNPTTIGPRTVVAGITVAPAGAVWDGSKIWLATVDGDLVRIDPSAPGVLELTLSVAPSGTDLIYDPDDVSYPDGKPKLFMSTGVEDFVYRITNLETLTPSVDASTFSTVTRLFLGPTFLYGGESGSLSRFTKEPLGSDFSVAGPAFPLGAVYDPVSNKGFLAFIDGDNLPAVSRYSTALVLEDTAVLDARSFGAIPFVPFGMAAIGDRVYVPSMGFSDAGRGNVFRVGTSDLSSDGASFEFQPHYGSRDGRVQYIVTAADPDLLTWDGVSDIIAVSLQSPSNLSVLLPSGNAGKRVVVIDAGETAGPGDVITVTPSGLFGTESIDSPGGALEFLSIGFGLWKLVARLGGGGGGISPPAGDIGGTVGTPLVIGLEGIPFVGGSVPSSLPTGELDFSPTSGLFSFAGLAVNQYTATSIGVSQNNFAPTNPGLTGGSWESARLVKLASSADVSITGFSISQVVCRQKVLVSVSSFAITLVSNSGSSSPANRIATFNNAPFVLNSGESVLLVYDEAFAVWRPVGYPRQAVARTVTVSFSGALLSTSVSPSATASFAGMVAGDGVLLNPTPTLASQISGPTQAFVREAVSGTDIVNIALSCLGGAGTVSSVTFTITRFPK